MVKPLARIAPTKSTHIFHHQRSDVSLKEEQLAIVDARLKAISYMECGQWDKFCELLLSAEQADKVVKKGRKGRWNRRRNGRKFYGVSSGRNASSGSQAEEMLPLSHDLLDLDSDHSTLFHALVAYRAPVFAIRALHRVFPSMIQFADWSGRTPLHWAVRSSSLGVINSLLELHPHAANAQDCRGRTPLIQACVDLGHLSVARWGGGSEAEDFACSVERDARLRFATELVQRLVRASPKSALAEDEEGMTALEYAIDALAPRKMVGELQMVTVAVMEDKERRRRRLSDCKSVKEEAQKQPWQQIWMPHFVAFGASSIQDSARRSTSGVRMVAPSA